MKTDAAIKRTRDARRDISAGAGDDPVRLVEYYMEVQKRFAARLCPGPGTAQEGHGMAEQDLAADAQRDARR
jgi:hypothetical protein